MTTKQTLCVWFPQWKRQARCLIERCRQPALRSPAGETVDPRGASQPGGGPPFVLQWPADSTPPPQAVLEQLALWCEVFSPQVGVETADEPECLLLEIGGVTHLFGGDRVLAGHVQAGLERLGLEPRLALGETIGAAWAEAHYGRPLEFGDDRQPPEAAEPTSRPAELAQRLAPLPTAALRLPSETLAVLSELGVERIEQLLALPRKSLTSRFGPQLLLRLDQALGRVPEVLHCRRPPPAATAHWDLEPATGRQDVLLNVIEILLQRVVAELGPQRGVEHFACRFDSAGAPAVEISLRLFAPTAQVKHLLNLVRLRLEGLRLRREVDRLHVSVEEAGWLTARQQSFWDQEQADDRREFAALVDRLGGRLGPDRVLHARCLPEAQPEFAVVFRPLVQKSHRGAPVAPGLASGSTSRTTRAAGRRQKRQGSAAKQAAEPLRGSRYGRPWRPWRRPLAFRQSQPLEVLALAPEGPPLRFRSLGRASHLAGPARTAGGARGGPAPAGELQQVVRHWGPERIETGWWRGRPVRRDYYRVETENGAWLWIYRRLTDGRWFWQGSFA